MNKNKYNFNTLLRKYWEYTRRRNSLRLANKNERRQKILSKHIERLYERLISMKLSLQKGALVSSVAVGALTMLPNASQAQSFLPVQTNPFNLVDVSGYQFSNPSLGDLDGDGDLDLISGQYESNYISPGNYSYDSQIIYFENTGTATNPVFAAPQESPFGLTSINQYGTLAPTFVDIDDDGDLDIMVTDYYGEFRLYENTGTASAPAFGAPIFNPFSLVGVGNNANSQPSFADLDNDGDLDLIVGDYYNYSGNQQIYYYENIGTAGAPDFGAQQINPFSLNPTSTNNYLNHLDLVDVDGDGDYDLVMGDYDDYEGGGFMKFFENIGTPAAPAFGPEQINPFGLESLEEANGYVFDDLDGDGLMDILAGDSNQSFYFWKGCQPTSSSITLNEACSYTSSSGIVYTSSGTYIEEFTNSVGCDSTVTINLTIDLSVTNNTTSLTANLVGATYQWVDCDDNNSPIAGETAQTFTPTVTGNYAVEITASGCTETSACEAITVDQVGLVENNFGSNFLLYPNPTKNSVNVDFGKKMNSLSMNMVSIEGKSLFTKDVNDQFVTIDVSTYPKGVYILHISDGESTSYHRIIKH